MCGRFLARTDNKMYLEDMSEEQRAQVIADSGYSEEQLKEENPCFIAEYDFEDYARELAEDIGAVNDDNQWPLTHIDWKSASEELEMDYSSIDLDGTTYLFRAW